MKMSPVCGAVNHDNTGDQYTKVSMQCEARSNNFCEECFSHALRETQYFKIFSAVIEATNGRTIVSLCGSSAKIFFH